MKKVEENVNSGLFNELISSKQNVGIKEFKHKLQLFKAL